MDELLEKMLFVISPPKTRYEWGKCYAYFMYTFFYCIAKANNNVNLWNLKYPSLFLYLCKVEYYDIISNLT